LHQDFKDIVTGEAYAVPLLDVEDDYGNEHRNNSLNKESEGKRPLIDE
jgi:hypothetical protein